MYHNAPNVARPWTLHHPVIEQILQHLDLWEQPQRAPPPRLFPHKLQSFLASLSPQQAQAVRASSGNALFWDEVPIWED